MGNYADLTNKPDFHKVATTGSYEDLTNKPSYPTRLADMIQDENYYTTVTRVERELWNSKSGFTGNYEDLSNKPFIPTRLQDLSQDAEYYTTVSRAERDTWNNKSNFSGSYTDLKDKPFIPVHLQDLTQDVYFSTITHQERLIWNNKSDFNGTWEKLDGKPSFASIAFTGSWSNLSDKPNIPRYLSDLSGDADNRTITDVERKLWNSKSNFSGNYEDLSNKPFIGTKLEDFTSTNSSLHFTKEDRDLFSLAASGDLEGVDHNFTIKESVKLWGSPTLNDHTTISKAQYLNIADNQTIAKQIADLKNVYEMIRVAQASLIPTNAVIMWNSENPIPCGWERVAEMEGRFPVAAGTGNGLTYKKGDMGGLNEVQLTVEQMPSHTHRLRFKGGDPATGSGKSAYIDSDMVNSGKIESTGGDKPHENRPPYYALYFIQKTNEVCPKL